MDDGFSIRGGLENRTLVYQLVAQRDGIGEIAIVRERNAPYRQIGEHRLHIAHSRAASGRIPNMTERMTAAQLAGMDAVLAEHITNQPMIPLGDELRAVIGNYAGRFLAAMLQR